MSKFNTGDLAPADLSVYTHMVVAPDGRQFSVHFNEADAQKRADQIKGTVAPNTPNPSTYWNTEAGTKYDH